ncbi:lysylphosphatidylglycerol synthase transmembrane domain-containing protein [Tautonia sociabilis]|uniref:Flippase-like domain-containing protein n=1 Tax=Tautonia sociabilis TaxID=2080755 RepID=A0A432MGU1_9BACT|nr:lysylphosphatidylglycerol synthase transmembrane domain-containing protein [Tautonia sociabilis]RUL85911.1 flippase-like domain-containing protein [Tautonia sociabilis]
MTRTTRSLLVNLTLSVIALALLGLAISSNREQLRAVMARKVDGPTFAFGFVVYLSALVLTFLRWFALVRALGLPFRVADAIRLGFIGNVFNLVIPGAVGGDVIKGAFLCREQAKKTQAVASMVIDRLLGLIGLFLLAGLAGAWAWSGSTRDVRILIGLAWAASVSGPIGLAILFSPALFRPMLRLVAGRGKLGAILAELVTAAGVYRSKRPVVLGALASAMLSHGLFVLAFYLVDRALFRSEVPSLADHYVVVPLSIFSTSVPLPFGALGLSEQVSDFLFQQVDHPGGAVAMMGFRALMYAGGLLSVVVYLANLRQVRSLRSDSPEPVPGPGA